MPYRVQSVCDSCGRGIDLPAKTIGQLAQLVVEWAERVEGAQRAGVPDDQTLTIRCPECSARVPIPSGSVGILPGGELKKGVKAS